MTFASYNLNIPFATNAPSSDQPNMLQNTNSINSLLAIDHVSFNLSNGGYHNVVHLTSQATPSTVPTIGEIYSTTVNDGIGTSEILFFQNSAGQVTQLSRNFAIVNENIANPDFGQTSLSGGLILQWGFVSGTHSGFLAGGDSGTVTFSSKNIQFPFNCYSVWTQLFWSGSAPNGTATVAIHGSSVSQTGFQWNFVSNSGSYSGFYWIALGN